MAKRKSYKRTAKKAARSAERAAKRHPRLFLAVVVILLVILIAAGYWYFFIYKNQRPNIPGESGGSAGSSEPEPSEPSDPIITGELSIHFLELGNKYTGDCVYIKIGDVDILIDGGSRESSADTIEKYVKNYCTDGVLEYVIVTHADQDHIAAFAGSSTYKSLFERFECEMIIDFPRTNKDTAIYNTYIEAREKEVEAGAVHYTALECYQETNGAKRSYELADGVSMNFLYNYYYDHSSSDENNYSVCMYIQQGEFNYLFTGDLEKDGEKRLVENNELPKCKLFKGGHHGSSTSSTEILLSVIQPEIVCICCCAGAPEYAKTADNSFPTKETLERLSRYTDEIYVTSMATEVDWETRKGWGYTSLNGNIVVVSDGVTITVTGSNHSERLKDTQWYKDNRSN